MDEPLVKPKPLRAGETIGVAAPASPFDDTRFREGVKILESMGFSVRVPDAVFERDGYLAGSDESRAKHLMDLFRDETIRAVFCARGGFGAMKILPLLDFQSIRENPKILVGFSDITALSLALYHCCGLVSLHGPLVTTLGKGLESTITGLKAALSSPEPPLLSPVRPEVLRPGKGSGPVLGGNLATLTHLMGTPYEPPFKGAILFLEDRGEAAYRIDRMLSQLRLAGRLDEISGVILGTFEDCGPLDTIYSVVTEAFSERDIPILAGFDFGHGPQNVAFPIGPAALLDTDLPALRFQESFFDEASS